MTDDKDVVSVAKKEVARVVEETNGGQALIDCDLSQETFPLVPDLHHSISTVV